MAVKYELVEHSNGFHDEHWCIKISEGNYEGVVYQYDTIRIEEPKDDGDAVLNFNTITVENPNKEDLTSLEFEGIIGDILVKIISERMEEVDESRTSDIEKSDT